MNLMQVLRGEQFRRRMAAGTLAVWLFTMLVCASESHATGPVLQHAEAAASTAHPERFSGHDGTQADDGCCQSQGSGIATSVKLPDWPVLPGIASLAALFLLALPLANAPRPAVPPDPGAVRRRLVVLAHSLQPQAPPR